MNKENGFHTAISPALVWAPGLHWLLLLLAAACLLMACGLTGAVQAQTAPEALPAKTQPEFPQVLRGVWDIAPQKCATAHDSGSDTRIEIDAHVLQGYEHTDQLKTIEKISSSPVAWRVVTSSDIAPQDIQDRADTYVLQGQNLTISNGTSTVDYMRCADSTSLGGSLRSASTGAAAEYTEFPRELVGLWIGTQYACPSDEGFDGEDIMDITSDELFGYEEVYKSSKVTLISESPKTWEIRALIDVGPDGVFSEFGLITFTLSDGILTTDHKPHKTHFKKCR